MSVPENSRTKSKLEVCVKAQNTLTIDTDLQPSEMTITFKG